MIRPLGSRGRHGALKLEENPRSDPAIPTALANEVVKISVIKGAYPGKRYRLSRPPMTIGRVGGGADLEIDDPEVSRVHCSIEVREDTILLQDLRSKNGTFVEDSRIFVSRLEEKSVFRVGTTVLQVDRSAI
jgi:pSer/pThr/pTyr-binding forkhead associated (FHA) protein